MLIAIQFPIADLRTLLANSQQRVPSPNWPKFVPPQKTPHKSGDFVRCFGGVGERRRETPGHAQVWSSDDEDSLEYVFPHWTYDAVYCDARKALRFPELGQSKLATYGPASSFRRLFTDGQEYVRFEIGVALTKAKLAADDFRQLLTEFMELPTRVPMFPAPPKPNDRAAPSDPLHETIRQRRRRLRSHPEPAPLVSQSGELATLYGRSTLAVTDLQDDPVLRNDPHSAKFVKAGKPMIFVEYVEPEINDWLESLASKKRASDNLTRFDSKKLGDVNLAYFATRDKSSKQNLGVWLLDGSIYSPAIRNLRLCVFQAYAEREILNSILDAFRNKNYALLEHADRKALQTYLEKAKQMLTATTSHGCQVVEIKELLAGFRGILSKGPAATLESELQKLEERLGGSEVPAKREKPTEESIRALTDFLLNELTNQQFEEFAKVHVARAKIQFTSEQSRGFRVQLVMDEVQRQKLLPKLAPILKKLNPIAYPDYESRLIDAPLKS
jgi:hypothetical protein